MASSAIKGVRGDKFRSHIENILKRAKLSDEFMNLLLSDSSMAIYDKAFTSSTVNELHNYEIFEQLGDGILASFIVSYPYKRFPQLNKSDGFKIVAVIKIKYGSEDILSTISESLNFYEFITYSNAGVKPQERHKLLEDVFEAFIGATAYILDETYQVGVGYHVCYNILKVLYDELHISLDHEFLVSPVTRLKEIGDAHREQATNIGNIKYDHKIIQQQVSIGKYVNMHYVKVISNILGVLAESRGETKQRAMDSAAEIAIKVLRNRNPPIYRDATEIWKKFST